MAATKQEILDVLNTIGHMATMGHFNNLGLGSLLGDIGSRVAKDGILLVFRSEAGARWNLGPAGGTPVTFRVVRESEITSDS